jgi:hypothetical protein
MRAFSPSWLRLPVSVFPFCVAHSRGTNHVIAPLIQKFRKSAYRKIT